LYPGSIPIYSFPSIAPFHHVEEISLKLEFQGGTGGVLSLLNIFLEVKFSSFGRISTMLILRYIVLYVLIFKVEGWKKIFKHF